MFLVLAILDAVLHSKIKQKRQSHHPAYYFSLNSGLQETVRTLNLCSAGALLFRGFLPDIQGRLSLRSYGRLVFSGAYSLFVLLFRLVQQVLIR